MNDFIATIFSGIAKVLEQPAAAAVIASIVSITGTIVITRLSATAAARSAHREYLRRRHDRFDDALVALADVADEWAKEELALLNTYAQSKPDHEDSDGEQADALRQQITNSINRLRVLIPHQRSDSPTPSLVRRLKAFESAWGDSLAARRFLEHAIGPWKMTADEVQAAHGDGIAAIQHVEQALGDLFDGNTAHVRTS